jgi:hypothetical protein
MKKTIRQYRNKNDFIFGSFKVRTGSAWMQITGKLKKTGKDTVFMDIIFESGNGTIEVDG